MNKNKTLKELALEYEDYILQNEENIASVKNKIKTAQENSDLYLVLELKRTLAVLYEISRELKENHEHIMNYNNNDN